MDEREEAQIILSQIGSNFCSDSEKKKQDIDQLIEKVKICHLINSFDLDRDDILIIAIAWYKFISDRNFFFDPVELLSEYYASKSQAVQELDRVIKLLQYKIFYTRKKRIIAKHGMEHRNKVVFNKSSLLEEDIQFHPSFLKKIIGERENIQQEHNLYYNSNKEFLNDWFVYINKLEDFIYYDFADRYSPDDDMIIESDEILKALEWKERINSRLKKTNKNFPLMDIVNEHQLDDNETIILMYLAKEDVDGGSADMDNALKMISRNQHEMYQNRDYFSLDSKLVKNGLVEIPDNVFFRSRGCDVCISPDITRRIIMRTPVNDEERIRQILKGNDIFSLLDPLQSINDLMLPKEMKDTINIAINRYQSNVDNTLEQWGLYEGQMRVVGQQKKKIEPGLLMLFHGLPGTGKTFAAGAIASALNKKLLVTDISRLQSKWVGDSEKNVKRMFTIFERIVRRTENPPVLLLNEADQFLTKRLKNTNTSVDVMYNTLQNLFLEAFEQLRGVLIATTNLSDNLDNAFSRRFHLKLEFPAPGYKMRLKLWKLHLPNTIPGVDDIDLGKIGKYQLTGGQINIIVKNAATEAASRQETKKRLTIEDLQKYCELENKSMLGGNRRKIGF